MAYAERFTVRTTEIHIDRTVLLFTFAISLVTGLIFGSVPALSGSLGIAPALRDGGRATQNRQSVRSALIVIQVAASFMLLIGAGLTLRTGHQPAARRSRVQYGQPAHDADRSELLQVPREIRSRRSGSASKTVFDRCRASRPSPPEARFR